MHVIRFFNGCFNKGIGEPCLLEDASQYNSVEEAIEVCKKLYFHGTPISWEDAKKEDDEIARSMMKFARNCNF